MSSLSLCSPTWDPPGTSLDLGHSPNLGVGPGPSRWTCSSGTHKGHYASLKSSGQGWRLTAFHRIRVLCLPSPPVQ